MRTSFLLIVLSIPIAASGPIAAQVIAIEAEWYNASHDIGNVPIGIQVDAGCSGGLMLIGLDLADEWTSYDVPVDPPGVYAPRLICRGNTGVEYHLRLTFVPDTLGGQQTIDFFYAGIGYG